MSKGFRIEAQNNKKQSVLNELKQVIKEKYKGNKTLIKKATYMIQSASDNGLAVITWKNKAPKTFFTGSNEGLREYFEFCMQEGEFETCSFTVFSDKH